MEAQRCRGLVYIHRPVRERSLFLGAQLAFPIAEEVRVLVIRFLIDVIGSIESKQPQIEFIDPDFDTEESLSQGSCCAVALPVKTNRFTPSNFVFRCKAIERL